MSAPNATYYDSGSTQVATLSAVLLKKLEQRRVLTKDAERLVIVLVGLVVHTYLFQNYIPKDKNSP